MRLSLCTISFRHHLVSLEDLAVWASGNGFQGIELWGAHARNMAAMSDRGGDWLAQFGLSVPMVSDYLPLDGDPDALVRKTLDLCRLAQRWGAGKIRTFAGSTGSAETSPERRIFIAERLRTLCGLAADHGLSLLVETHPGTLADTLTATRALIAAVGHPALKVNFDVLHVWEGGDDPVAARRALRPHIGHYHLKNIRDRDDLSVFEPANVYAAAGRRDGMVPLFDGVVDYRRFLAELADDPAAEGSLEWFGDDCYAVLRGDRDAVEAALAPMADIPPRRVAGSRHGAV
ncbi:sugar phosphate isomerase/epimerase (plasmid) [Azospirillum humicireducens]|uniref:Sugar phosphate isomerase/epimerase n=1 Tax=Azospirillum humicireducens TaxID=1226968 RepID=A0A2R4VQ42_9PROT|nr:sugar phosphate isomerase/epimerase family protein [Azospirillum humicireducens]AWB06546.1 sugar phosphate isomerase/epimerase [Azospirillum humicireducens]